VPKNPSPAEQPSPLCDAAGSADHGLSSAFSALTDDRSPMPTNIDPSRGVNPAVNLEETDSQPSPSDASSESGDAHAAIAAAAPKTAGSARQARQARQAREAKLQGVQANSMGFQFRQIAIPLLLMMALMLGIVAGLAFYLGATYQPSEENNNIILEHGMLFGGITGVLALALFVGAFVFHWEVSRAKKEQQKNNGKTTRRGR
jgi:hypothetical protein